MPEKLCKWYAPSGRKNRPYSIYSMAGVGLSCIELVNRGAIITIARAAKFAIHDNFAIFGQYFLDLPGVNVH